MPRLQLSRDPSEAQGLGEIVYEVTGPVGSKYRVNRTCDNGAEASLYTLETADLDFANGVAARMAESEGGTLAE